jgi:hypothetical protein
MAEDILPGKYKKMKNGKFELGHTCACENVENGMKTK